MAIRRMLLIFKLTKAILKIKLALENPGNGKYNDKQLNIIRHNVPRNRLQRY